VLGYFTRDKIPLSGLPTKRLPRVAASYLQLMKKNTSFDEKRVLFNGYKRSQQVS
jgi:hypothetical protein